MSVQRYYNEYLAQKKCRASFCQCNRLLYVRKVKELKWICAKLNPYFSHSLYRWQHRREEKCHSAHWLNCWDFRSGSDSSCSNPCYCLYVSPSHLCSKSILHWGKLCFPQLVYSLQHGEKLVFITFPETVQYFQTPTNISLCFCLACCYYLC